MDNRRIEIPIIFLLSFALVFCTHYLFPETNAKKIESIKSTIDSYGYEFNPIKTIKMVDMVEASSIEEEIIYSMSEEDIQLIALVTMAEAEGEPEEGKRLVIDTILNRVDSPCFPNSVYEVIYQPSQFTSMWNGRSDRCYVREDIYQLVKEELESRTNSDVIFFRTTRYSDYGVTMFQVGHHYFSSYD